MGDFIKRKVKKYIRSFQKKYKNRIKVKAYKDSKYANIFYGFFDNSFKRQHYATLRGIKKFEERGYSNQATLIRNLHRIEKGLIMPYKKSVFAKDFIMETVLTFKDLEMNLKKENNDLYCYSREILNSYFQINDKKDPIVEKAFETYCSTHNISPLSANKVPYSRSKVILSKISFDEFLKLSKQRRSVRFFEQKRVGRNLIEKAINAALQSPSACNRQPFRLIVADDPIFKNKIGAIPMGATTYYENVPVLLAIIGDLSNYFSERDRNLIYIDGALFAMSFMFALETLGLASCPINWPDIEEKEKELQKILKLEDYERCVLLIGFGYPDKQGQIPYSQKKNLESITQYNNTYDY